MLQHNIFSVSNLSTMVSSHGLLVTYTHTLTNTSPPPVCSSRLADCQIWSSDVVPSDILFISQITDTSQKTPAVYLGLTFIGLILLSGTFGFVIQCYTTTKRITCSHPWWTIAIVRRSQDWVRIIFSSKESFIKLHSLRIKYMSKKANVKDIDRNRCNPSGGAAGFAVRVSIRDVTFSGLAATQLM